MKKCLILQKMKVSIMKEINEEDLHLYIINKNQLDAAVITEIEKRASTESAFRKKIEEIEEYYHNYEMFSKIAKEGVFHLLPIVNKNKANEQITLAAQHNNSVEMEEKYIQTFISSDKYVMIRMFRNSALGEYEFYLVSDNSELVKNAVIKIPSLQKELISNEEGIAKIQIEYLPDNIELFVEARLIKL